MELIPAYRLNNWLRTNFFQRSWNTRANEGYKPQKGNPAWLLQEFLDDWCPDGGTINVGLARF